MSDKLILPQDLWEARDSAIAGLHSGTPHLDAEKTLETWVLSEGAYPLITEGGDTGIGTMCDLHYSEPDIRDQLDLTSDDEITTDDLAQFARLMMEDARADSCGPYLEAHAIEDSSGRAAVIGLLALAAGQGGMEFTWRGLFADQVAFINSIRDSGCAVDSWLPGDKTFDTYTDEELVALMRK